MTKRLEFGVADPITIAEPGPYDWHAWRREHHGDVWLGFFTDDKAATAWAQTQPFDVVVNNVPPSTSRRYITGDYTWGSLADGNTVVPNRISRSADAPRPKRAAPVRRAVQTLPNPFKPAPRPVETAEQKALKADAAKRLDQHKQDEAADIAAGKTEVR
jgi:hypothetical protein